MSSPSTAPRPSQVTLAGWVAVVGCVLLVATLFESMGNLRTVEVRDTIEEFLSSPPGSGLGLTTAGAIELLHGLTLFAGALAAAAAVLGIYVLRRHNAARIAFTVAAVFIVLVAPFAGGFLPVMIGLAAASLWTRPAREWFAGRAPVAVTGGRLDDAGRNPFHGGRLFSGDRAGGDVPSGGPEGEPVAGPPVGPGPAVPPPTPGFGTTPYGTPEYGTPQQGQPPYGQPPQGQPQYAPPQYGPPQYGQPPFDQPPFDQPQYGQPPYGPQHAPYGYPSAAAERRPVTVTIAAALTWVFAGITLLGYTLIILALVAAQDQLIDALQSEPQFQELGLPTRDFLAVLWTMCAVVMVWCVAALVLAVLAFRRSNWARIVLAVSAAASGLLTLLAVVSAPFLVFHLLASLATVVLLFVGGSNRWYARREQSGYGGYPSQLPQQYGAPASPPGGSHAWQPPSEQEKEPPKNVW